MNLFILLGDPCIPNPCLNGGACTSNGFGGFTCQCPPGYSGQRCEDRKILKYSPVACFYLLCIYQVILVLLNHAWIKARACKIMVVIVVCVHQDIPEVDVKFVMHVKVILAWMGEHVNLSMEMVDINVYVHQVIVDLDAKQVRVSTEYHTLLFFSYSFISMKFINEF
jgi:hypothetical protein